MRVEGSVAIEAPRDRVWQFLTDPAALSGCTPGLTSWTAVEPGRSFEIVGQAALGGAAGGNGNRVRLTAVVEWQELDPPRRMAVAGHVAIPGGPLNVDGALSLTPHPDGSTRLQFHIQPSLPAGAAPFMAGMVVNLLPKMVEKFFRCAKARLETAALESNPL